MSPRIDYQMDCSYKGRILEGYCRKKVFYICSLAKQTATFDEKSKWSIPKKTFFFCQQGGSQKIAVKFMEEGLEQDGPGPYDTNLIVITFNRQKSYFVSFEF